MKRLMILVALTSCGGAQNSHAHECPPRGCGEVLPPPQTLTAPPPRTETVVGEDHYDGITIAARPYAITGWEIAVQNDTDDPILISWDRSVFVDSEGTSHGRLILASTRRIDAGRATPPATVPPHAKLREKVFVEKMFSVDDNEAKFIGKEMPKAALEKWMSVRALVRKAIIGGRLSIALEIDGEKQTWNGRVVEPGAAGAETGE